jgi:membrane-associated phospholipid phosphatase
MRIRVAVTTALLTLTQVAGAQSLGKMLGDDFKHAGEDVWSIWTSPFDAKGRDWAIFAAALGITGVSILADQEVADWAVRNDSNFVFRAIKPIRRGGKAYTGKYVVPPIAAMYLIGLATKNQGMRDFVLGCGSSWMSQSLARKAVYLLVGRARPDTMPDNPHHWTFPGSSEWQMHSMPAGHFANVMSCVTFWNHRFKWGAAEPALYALAAAVGVGRIADRGHWFSDHIMGGIAGFAVGREVARRSLKRRGALGGAGGSAAINLSPSPDGVTFSVGWTF